MSKQVKNYFASNNCIYILCKLEYDNLCHILQQIHRIRMFSFSFLPDRTPFVSFKIGGCQILRTRAKYSS